MRGKRYTAAQIEFIRGHADIGLSQLAELFYLEFGEKITPSALGKRRGRMGLDKLPTHPEGSMFTRESDEFLLKNWRRMTSRQLATALHKYGIRPKTQTVTERLNALGVHRGAYYKPDGYLQPKCLPVGSERVKHGNVLVKVEQPNKWKYKTQLIMGHNTKKEQVIFLDGNRFNFDKENLLVVSKRTVIRLAQNGWLDSDGEVIKAGVTLYELMNAIRDIEKGNSETDGHT